MIRLQRRATKVMFSIIDVDKDQGWMGWFVRVRTSDLIPAEKMPFPEEWNLKHSPWFPGAIPDLAGLGDNVVMRPPPLEEGEASKPTKDKKRRSASTPDTPKPKKNRAQKWKIDPSVLSVDVVQTLRNEDEEGEDADCLLVARKKEGIKALRTAEPVTIDEVQPQIEVISGEGPSRVLQSSGADDASCRDEQSAGVPEGSSSEALQREEKPQVQQKAELVEQLREEAKMKEAETLGWKQNMDRLASEKEAVRAQLSLVELQLQSVKKENLARAQKIEELEIWLATELARATSEVEELVTSYRADVEAANTRAKEISDAAEVRLSRVAEHTRRKSRRETLKEVHARGFDLTADIENAKVLEDEVRALLSDEEDSASRSESRGDEDEAPEAD
ncbi:vicilin-like seed storage protein At2g18540 [Nicotiana tomentosiformis]|uniref:vicilin-like seed storage protein At2g18540 n=1 Tax=Nicotiana tomentosiformis TaxID=4098 RepID=UPI00388C6287